MDSETGLQQGQRPARGAHLAWVLAVAYLLVIAYASLQPFRGWWIPPDDIRRFLTAPWPRYITLEDVLINLSAYAPLGFLLSRALMARQRTLHAVLLAAALACLLSVLMETFQMFMSTRIASNVDVMANGLGGLIGALAAPLFSPTRRLGLKLSRLRRAWFVYGPGADVGLLVLALWLATQLHPTAQLFGTGNLRHTFDLPTWFIHTPHHLLAAQAAVAGFNMLGLGLIVIALARATLGTTVVFACVLVAGIAAKTSTALVLATTPSLFAWLTPGVVIGMVLATLLLYGLHRLPRRVQWVAAALSFTAAVAAINLAPENPYQSVPAQLLAGPTHYLSFSGIVRALSELWPLLAISYTAVAAVRVAQRENRAHTGA